MRSEWKTPGKPGAGGSSGSCSWCAHQGPPHHQRDGAGALCLPPVSGTTSYGSDRSLVALTNFFCRFDNHDA